jgi:hypothetical protein
LTEGTGKSQDGYFSSFGCGDCWTKKTSVELCYDYEIDNYDDWFLPAEPTLELMYELWLSGTLENFDNAAGCGTSNEPIYASSNGSGANNTNVLFLKSGTYAGKVGRGSFGVILNVRPVRRF